jgi:hypothetical protein
MPVLSPGHMVVKGQSCNALHVGNNTVVRWMSEFKKKGRFLSVHHEGI